MVDRQLRRRGVTDDRVLSAMARVPRELFVPASVVEHAYDDGALPIGHRQTISQPFVVGVFPLALQGSARARFGPLRAATGLATTRVLPSAHRALADEAGRDRRRRVRERGSPVGDGSLGVPERAPFDGIAVAAAAAVVPPALRATRRGAGGSSCLAARAGDRNWCSS
jgi:protein-L-isoaspartate(D-aspartate) O-methyltransferase